MPWAENILATVSGLSLEERNAVKATVEGAGGRYTPSLSRRCTHLVVFHDADAASSRKLTLALHNRTKWCTHIVTPAWITACSEGGMRLPEQDFAATAQQELAPEHRPNGQPSHIAQPETCSHQPRGHPSCSTPGAAISGAAAPQVPVGSPAMAKSRLRRQRSRRLSRFAPGPETAAQENVALLPRPGQPRGYGRSSTSNNAAREHCGEKPAATDERLTVEASGQAFARRPGLAGRIAHPAQQPLQQLQGSSRLHQQPDIAHCQLHTHAAKPPPMSAASGASPGALQQLQPQNMAPRWVVNQQQQPRPQPMRQPACGLHMPTSTAASMSAADVSSYSSCADVAAQLAHAVEAPARSVHSAGGAPEGRAGVCAKGVPTGGFGANARTGNGGASLGGSRGWATDACTEGLAAKLAALCHSKSSHTSRSTHDSNPPRSDAPGAPHSDCLPPQISSPGSSEALGVQLATVKQRHFGHNHSSATNDIYLAGDGNPASVNPPNTTVDRTNSSRENVAMPDQRSCLQQGYAAKQNPCADTPSLDRETGQQCEQEVTLKRGVFEGMRAVLDASLDPSEAKRVRKAIRAGGGECATGGFLGGSASHVICSPSAASKWLAMGVHVVSAAWVLQSAKSGRQERCLLLSADALRGLPLASPPSMQEMLHPSDASAEAAARSASTCATVTHAWEALLDQADQRASAMSHHYQTPAALLEDVVWAVTDPPERARLNRICASSDGTREDQADVVPDSEDEQETPQQQDRMCAGDWDHAMFSATHITVLFPADAAGALCHVSRTLRCDAPGPSRRHLLTFLHAFYQETLTPAEISEALQGGLRCSSEVRGNLLAGRGIQRGDLLGSHRNFEGLSRVSRCRNATVYELNLSC